MSQAQIPTRENILIDVIYVFGSPIAVQLFETVN
jgi:hypothetical protein